MPNVLPLTGFRYYSRIPASTAQSPVVSFGYVLDSGVVWQQQDGTIVTGAMRPTSSADIGSIVNLNVSGLSLTVGSVALTGAPVVTLTGSVSTIAANVGTGPSTAVSGLVPLFFGITLPNNPARRAWSITNLSTGALMVKMSSTIPTTGNLDILLKGASAPWIGDGATWTDSPATYVGPVAVSGFGGANCIWRAWEI